MDKNRKRQNKIAKRKRMVKRGGTLSASLRNQQTHVMREQMNGRGTQSEETRQAIAKKLGLVSAEIYPPEDIVERDMEE